MVLINFSNPKTKKMGQTEMTVKKQSSQKTKSVSSKTPSVFDISELARTQVVEKFDNSPRMTENELNALIEMVKIECEDSLFLGGYEDSIIGYDYNSKAIIYDGDQILNRLADSAIKEDIEAGIEIYDRWEYYYDVVDDFEYNVLRFLDSVPTGDDKIKPIILRSFS
jgi:hypothetical protein